MLPSGNDAAIAIAQQAAGTVPAFVALMNARARAMGLACTRFSTVSGIRDAGNHSCAPDLAALARAVLREPRLARIVRRRSAVLPFPIKGRKLYLYNNNPLLRIGYRGTTGVKTGYTEAAGRCLVATRATRGPAARRRAARLAGSRPAGDAAVRPRLQRYSLTITRVGVRITSAPSSRTKPAWFSDRNHSSPDVATWTVARSCPGWRSR